MNDTFSVREYSKLMKEIKRRDRNIGLFKNLCKEYEKDALAASKKVERKQYERELKMLPVDELSKYKLGIRIGALKDNGYKTILDLEGMTAGKLERLEGIGPKSASGTVYAVKDICKNVRSNLRVRVDVENPSKDEQKLIRFLYQAQAAKRLENDSDYFYKETHPKIEEALRDTAPARNWLVWKLTSDEKKQFVVQKAELLMQFADEVYLKASDSLLQNEYEIKKADHDDYWKSFVNNSAGYYATLEKIRHKSNRKTNGLNDVQHTAVKNGLPQELAIAISQVPLDLRGLSANLYPYQEYGVQYILNQGAVLLGDDMGLGKTMQAIAAMVSLKNSGATHFFVVCPASVIINWCREIQKFSDLSVICVHGTDAGDEGKQWINEGGVAVTTYETLQKIVLPEEFRFDLLVVDEAHYIKNPNAARTGHVLYFRQHTDRALFMSGTPLENRVSEMCFLIGCLQPEVAKNLAGTTIIAMAPEFRKKVSGVYFRRTKEDVLDELPDKVEKEEWIELLPNEKSRYRDLVYEGNFMRLRQASWIIPENEESSKLNRLKELVEEYLLMGRKIIVFSFFVNTIETIKKYFPNEVFGVISGTISPAKRQEIIDGFSGMTVGGVLLSQIQAGGTGLNIQAANVVIFCEPQLKPSIEEQAIARAYRMGQNNTVMVHRLLNVGTVDEQIQVLLSQKQELFDAFADKSESGEESLNSLGIKKLMDAEKERYS